MFTTTCAAAVLAVDAAGRTEAMAVAGLLAGYAGATHTGYATDLRIFATVDRRLPTLASFYRYCDQEQLTDRNPAPSTCVGQRSTTSSEPLAWTTASSLPFSFRPA